MVNYPDPDISGAAHGMIRNFGKEAAKEAVRIAYRLSRRRDPEGYKTWLAIAAAIKALREPTRSRAPNKSSLPVKTTSTEPVSGVQERSS